MKKLFTTTAIALITVAPLSAQQTQDTGQTETTTVQTTTGEAGMSGFHETMGQGDLRASELLNAEIYAQAGGGAQTGGATETTTEETDLTSAADQGAQGDSRWGQPMGAADMEGMQSVGTVNDLLLDQQGRVRALLAEVEGRQIAIDLNQVNFSTDEQDTSRIYVVMMGGADTLQSAPEFDQTAQRDMTGTTQQQATTGTTPGQTATGTQATGQADWRQGRTPMTAPQMQTEGYRQIEVSEMSADNLLGASVYDANNEDVGNIDDVVLGQDGQVQYAVIDVGGFLGIGTHSVAIGFDEMTVMASEGMADLRVHVDVTEASLEAMPEYQAR